MASQTKINQIKAELQNQGLEPSEQAVNAVLEILGSGKTLSTVDAVKIYKEQLNAQKNTLPPEQQILLNMANGLSQQQTNWVYNAALQLTAHRLATGNFGEINPETQNQLDNLMNQLQEVKTIDVNFTNVALPTSQTNLLPSSEEKEEKLPQSSLETV
ncbi:hypothetical protein NIES2119_31655 [[Phormidium ambiguum] IAM M-71]|uniref:Uncharacterized protein n=1 Tax=[Phormidium ambiguum] IAM M-71 TaxID=454136 RepID=A0A1U7I200_9CYAN|nr:hypothetical protein [Phormidium ambiguum]OKH30033.1 hypothetical protein NIES2119_31655 [Phormidium ambiguum IAM M-71]